MPTAVCRRFIHLGIILSCVLTASAGSAQDVTAEAGGATKFYLVGVGPGDPDLITLRAIRVIESVDLVLCSSELKEKFAQHLAGKEVAPASWRLFEYYGQDPAELEGQQRRRCQETKDRRDKFIARIREAIGKGKTVAVLDSGDPLIYGPFDWCLEEFEDLDPEVVPGLSCFNAANAALRKGITSSEKTKSVILTAEDWPGKTDTIEKLSVHQTTMVLFTMTAGFKHFLEKLSAHCPADTPVAVVKHAGYARRQEVIEGTLGTIEQRVGQDDLPFEYLIYVGDFLTHRYNRP